MKRILLTTLLALNTSIVSAAVQYIYTGPSLNLAYFENVPVNESSYLPAGITSITATLTLEEELGANHGMGQFIVSDFVISDGASILTDSYGGVSLYAQIATDQNGEIIDWDFWASMSPTLGVPYSIRSDKDSYDNSAYCHRLPCSYNPSDGDVEWATSTDGVGSWQVSPVPEPSTLALMLTGFGLIGFKSNRRRKLSF